MFPRNVSPGCILRNVIGTQPFSAYCRERGIPFEQAESAAAARPADIRRWTAALDHLPPGEQARVRIELEWVGELAGADGGAHLLAALGGEGLPPEDIPAGAALALWTLMRHPGTFRDVFFNHEGCAGDPWTIAQAPPGLPLEDLHTKAAALGKSLMELFRLREGTGRFCVQEVYPLDDAACFVVRVSDRPHLLEGFTDSGEHTVLRLRPALAVAYVYCPADGTLLLRSPRHARDCVLPLFQRFGRAVLGVELDNRCLVRPFDLDRLRAEFSPLPDADDMEAVRVKALHLRYPAHAGRPQVKLETSPADDSSAIVRLLKAHLPGGDVDCAEVYHAVLQVVLRVEGRTKSYFIRLWRDRCDLGPVVLGGRFFAALRRWGVHHEE